jgi:hypothetical protein
MKIFVNKDTTSKLTIILLGFSLICLIMSMKCVESFTYESACVMHGCRSVAKYYARLYVTETLALTIGLTVSGTFCLCIFRMP